MTRLEQVLLELGHGFAFVGRQYHFTVDHDDFYIDLLFFNWIQSRFVVVEPKIGRFEPIRELVPTDSEFADAVDATWDKLTPDRTDGDDPQS